MFGSKREQRPQKRIDSLIGVGTTIEGNIQFKGGLRIDGHVKGSVNAGTEQTATPVVSEQAVVDGEIHVSHVVVNGSVNGPIYANDFLELQNKAKVTGDIHYKTLEMHLGAAVQGKLLLLNEPEASSVVELKRSAVAPN